MSLDRAMARTLKLTLGENERICRLLPSEKKKSWRNLHSLSVEKSFLFGVLEKHQERQIEMETQSIRVLIPLIASTWVLIVLSVTE